MNLSTLLAQRQMLLRQTRLANLAFAYVRLGDLAVRIARARMHGSVNLKQAAPEAEACWASLTALEGNQSVIEEHFTDEDITLFADAIAFVTGENHLDLTFHIEELAERFVAPLRHQLEQAGVVFDYAAAPITEPHQGNSAG
jgi:hypothetical protein